MKKIIAILMAFVILCGCSGSGKVETVTYSGEVQGVKITQEIEYSKDKVSKQAITNELEFASAGVTKEQMQTLTDSYKTKYDVKGVTYEPILDDSKLIEKITINFKEADLKELSKAGLISIPSGNEDKVSYISYKETVKNLEASGLTKQ